MFGFKAWRRRRRVRAARLPEAAWRAALAATPLTHGLSADEQHRLREWVILFLHEKDFSGAGGLQLSEAMRLSIAVQACLLILNLDLDYYSGWVSIIVYPSAFRPRGTLTDEYGIVHEDRRVLSGEAWHNGPVILSWYDTQRSAYSSGTNVVIHEFAHKLDMLNGAANGMPPLHEDMNRQTWAEDFSTAYASFQSQVEQGEPTVVDPYAAESPAEFFAVMSEAFFVASLGVQEIYPRIYAQLASFYRQDPARRARSWLSEQTMK